MFLFCPNNKMWRILFLSSMNMMTDLNWDSSKKFLCLRSGSPSPIITSKTLAKPKDWPFTVGFLTLICSCSRLSKNIDLDWSIFSKLSGLLSKLVKSSSISIMSLRSVSHIRGMVAILELAEAGLLRNFLWLDFKFLMQSSTAKTPS